MHFITGTHIPRRTNRVWHNLIYNNDLGST